MPKLLIWGLGIAVGLLLLDRLLLWFESKGWLFYRRTKNRGGGSLYHVLQMHSVFDPSVQEIIEVKYGEEQTQDESGDPPVPEDEEGE